MIKLITSNGEEFNLAWIGIANLDGALRFGIMDSNVADIFQCFSNPENCTRLTRIFDENELVYEGYTNFRGFVVNYDGTIVVTLSKI